MTASSMHLSLLILFGVLFSYPTQALEPQTSKLKTVLFIGDSLTEGYGVRREEAYPILVEQILNRKTPRVRVINAGISGSVTAGADRRLRWFLKAKPQILVLALGGNDALKGTPTKVIKGNLESAIRLAKENQIQVVVAGMQIFTNFGEQYGREFEKLYRDLAKENDVKLIPFLLEGVALEKSLNLPDGKHPNAEGHKRIAELVAKELERLL